MYVLYIRIRLNTWYHMYSLSSIATPLHAMGVYTTRDEPGTIITANPNQAPLPVKVLMSDELNKSVTSLFSNRDIWVNKNRIQFGNLIKEGTLSVHYL